VKCGRFLLRMLSLFCKNYSLDFKKWVKSLEIKVKFICWLWFFCLRFDLLVFCLGFLFRFVFLNLLTLG
jgi:hypothetical protein